MTITRHRSQGTRLLRLIKLLEQEAYSSARLAQILGCTQQEIQRDLRLLRLQQWSLRETSSRPKQYFLAPKLAPRIDPVRAVVTHGLLRMLHHHTPLPSRIYHHAAQELAQTLPERIRALSPMAASEGNTPQILEALAAAWVYGEAVEFSYLKPTAIQPKRSVGDVVYMELGRNNLDWYVFIRRRGEEKVKTFHLSRFKDAVWRRGETSPAIPFDPSKELDGAWGIIGGREKCVIELLFPPESVAYVVYRRLPGQIAGVMQGDCYHLTIHAPLNSNGLPVEVMSWIRSWGSRVKILSPQWLKDEYLQELRETLLLYG